MTDRSVLVTGGGSGIGRAAALVFAREGARVLVADVDGEAASRTVEAIGAAGGHAVASRTDVTDPVEVATMVQRALTAFGRLDSCFNNAGIGTAATGSTATRLLDVSQTAWDRTIATNLTSVWHCLRAEIPHLLDRGGTIVNTASIAAHVALPGAAAYVASKHGVAALTRSAAVEYGGRGVRVNAVSPGYVRTPVLDAAVAVRGELDPANPLGRFATPEEVAETVVWLCSDRSAFVNGTTVPVDGGRLAT